MKYQEIFQKDIQELKVLIDETRDKIRAIRFDISSRNLNDHQQYGKAKKELAQLLTAYTEKSKK